MAPDHYAVWPVSGLFFLALGVVQIGWAGLAVGRPGSLALWSGVVINVGSALLWGITRTPVGQPFGPQAGEQLPIGTAGILTLVLEALVVVLVVAGRFVAPEVKTSAAVLAVAAAAAVALTVPGVASALEHDHGSHAGAEGGHEDGGHEDGGHEEGGHDDERAPTPSPDGSAEPSPSPSTTGGGSGDSGGHSDDGHGH